MAKLPLSRATYDARIDELEDVVRRQAEELVRLRNERDVLRAAIRDRLTA
jgi:hypothetical protein